MKKQDDIIPEKNTGDYCLRTLFELKEKLSSPAMVECSLPAAQPLFIMRAACLAGSPITRLPSTVLSYSERPFTFLSLLLFRSSSLSFLSQLSTVLCRISKQRTDDRISKQCHQSSSYSRNKLWILPNIVNYYEFFEQ